MKAATPFVIMNKGKAVSGAIETDIELIPFTIDEYIFRVERLPRKSCNRCYGTGKAGRRREDLKPVICRCMGYWKYIRRRTRARPAAA